MTGTLKQRIQEGQTLFSLWMPIDCPPAVEMAGHAGWDAVIFDLEHGEYWLDALPELVRSAEIAGTHTLTRVPSGDSAIINRVLETGTGGVIVPNVSSSEEAAHVVSAARYPPMGDRGLSTTGRSAHYGFEAPGEYVSTSSKSIVAVQVESVEGIEEFERIAATEGLDIVMFGVGDLSQRLALDGPSDPELVSVIRPLIEGSRSGSYATGIWAPTAVKAIEWAQLGVQLVSVSNAVALIGQAFHSLRSELADLHEKQFGDSGS